MRPVDPPEAPRSVLRPGDDGRTALGVFGGPVTAWIDQGGAVQLSDRSWCLDWWVQAGDRWHVPAAEPTVRQRRLGAGPVVQTAIRVPGGDVEHRAWMSQHDGWPVLVIEIENPTSAPVGVAVAARPYDLGGRPAEVRTEIGGDRLSVEANDGGTTVWCSVAIRDTLPGDEAAVLPLPHRSIIRLAAAPTGTSLDQLGDSAAAARGWDTLVKSSCRVVLPDDRLTAAFDQSRGRLSLGAVDLRQRVAHVVPGAGEELTAVALGGFDRQVRQLLDGLVADDWWPRLGGPAAAAAVLDGLAWAATLHAPATAEALLEAGTRLARAAGRDPGSRGRAEAALARLLTASDRLDHARTIAPGCGLGVTAPHDATQLARLLERASETGSWGGDDDPTVAAAVVQAIRHLVVSEAWAGTEPEVRLFPVWPAAWRGGSVEVHELATAFGRLSVAVRWHGYRPALLWQFDPTDRIRGGRLRCPGLDPTWSSTDRTGEVLLAGPAGGLGAPPAEGVSFS